MTKEQVRQAILNIISDIAPDEDLGTIKDEEKLRDQFDLDSMDFLDIVMELRKRFNLEVPEKTTRNWCPWRAVSSTCSRA